MRGLGRALFTTLAALAVLLAAAMMLWQGVGGPDLPSLAGLRGLDPADLGTALRLATWGVLALLALLLVLRVVVATAVLLGLNYAPLAHLAQLLLLPVVRRTAGGITAGMMLTSQVIGAGPAVAVGSAQAGRGPVTAASAHALAAPGAGRPGQAPALSGSPEPSTRPLRVPAARGAGQKTLAGRLRRQVIALDRGRARAAGAIAYTVQPGDTLWGIAAHFYGDPGAYRRLFTANRGVPQPDGGRLWDAGLIRTGWRLWVPLPSPVLQAGASGSLRYVVQEGDSLSEISAGLLGDWRRYRELLALNEGQRQPDGSALTDPALLKPGWVLRLPALGMHSVPARGTRQQAVTAGGREPARRPRLWPQPLRRKALQHPQAAPPLALFPQTGPPPRRRTTLPPAA